MATEITRRDFLNGVAIGVGGVLLSSYGGQVDAALSTEVLTNGLAGSGEFANYYPPTLTGMRGSHKGSFEVAHALAWQGQKPEQYQALDEQYDLVVVGTGMSGLAAAWICRYGCRNMTMLGSVMAAAGTAQLVYLPGYRV